MRALVIDSSSKAVTLGAKNEAVMVSVCLDLGLRQSGAILGAIDYVMHAVDISPCQLEWTACAIGPGSFTGLRLSLSVLKALDLSYNIPCYGIDTLDLYAASCMKEGTIAKGSCVLSLMSALRGDYYARIYTKVFAATSYKEEARDILCADIPTLCERLKGYEKVLVVGEGTSGFMAGLDTEALSRYVAVPSISICTALLDLSEQRYKDGHKPIGDFEGPVYIREPIARVSQ